MNGPGFQYGHSDKTGDYTAIMDLFQVEKECTILFDDAPKNGDTAHAAGILWQQASLACNGNQLCPTACGISEAEFNKGLAAVEASCAAVSSSDGVSSSAFLIEE